MGVDHEDLGDEILFPGAHAGASLAAAALGAVGLQRHALDIAVVADRHHHVLALDQVLDIDLGLGLDQFRAARCGELFLDLQNLVPEHPAQLFPRCQDAEELADLGADLVQLRGDLVALQPGQAVQPKLQDRPRLGLRQLVIAVDDGPARLVDELDQGGHVLGRPGRGHQVLAGDLGVRSCPDQGDDVVQIGHRYGQPDQDMGPVPGLGEVEDGAPGDHLFAEFDERGEDVPQVHHLRPSRP